MTRKGEEERAGRLPSEAVLNGLLLKRAMTNAWEILERACETYNPSHIFLFYSGGYDSFMSTFFGYEYLTRILRGERWSAPGCTPALKVVHVNTGIGIPETRLHVYRMQQMFQWPFAEYRTPILYRDLVLKHGFPGPASHRYMYIQLKERAIDQMVRDHTPRRDERVALFLEILKESRAMPLLLQQYLYAALLEESRAFRREQRSKLLFVTGVRREESARRMGHVKAVQEEGRRVWVAPLIDWTKAEIVETMARGFPHNPVVDTVHKSGECLCGSFAQAGELDELCFWYPSTGRYIRELERLVRDAGFPWGWEAGPPEWWGQMRRGQMFLPGMEPDPPQAPELAGSGIASLCSSCDARFELEQAHDERTCAGCALHRRG